MTALSAKAELGEADAAALSLSRTSVISALGPHRRNLAIPRSGHVLTAVSQEYGRPVRAAVSMLADALRDEASAVAYRSGLSRRISEPGSWVARRPAEMLAWTLVSAWLSGFVSGRVPSGSGLEMGATWFFSGMPERNPICLIPRHTLTRVDAALAECRDPAGYLELLPYVLDPHGPGSRMSIRRNAATRVSRDQKRARGVYYTPADLAGHMAAECLDGVGDHPFPPTVFDPACGTGVFLRAALGVIKTEFPHHSLRDLCETRLYGTDVDPWALDAAAFLLLADCLVDGREVAALPLSLWHRLRLNLACVDALRLDPACAADQVGNGVDVVGGLANTRLPNRCEAKRFGERVRLSQLFSRLPQKGLVILGNPPYSKLGVRSDFPMLERSFATLGGKAGPSSESYPLFVEQMVRLAPSGRTAGALVLPLSLASGVRRQFVEARSLIEKTTGRWRLAFFDREPHSLFGEDVKTRNAVVFWHREDQDHETKIESGPLRKWRGDSRAAMFTSIRFTPIVGAIRAGIPKVDGASQARAFEVFTKRWDRFEHVCANFRRMPLASVLKNDLHTVFVGATAYNFLNVFLNPPQDVLARAPVLSEHPLHAMDFPSRGDAAAAFALLSSHIAFWWWRVTQDGFHVTSRFLTSLPFGADTLYGSTGARLAEFGERLWSLIRTDPIVSRNRGRTSLAFSPNGFDDLRLDIDSTLAELAGLESGFVAETQQFTAHTIRAELGSASSMPRR